MNKWLIIILATIVVPFIAIYMWVRHPRRCWRELKHSWVYVFKGKDLDNEQ